MKKSQQTNSKKLDKQRKRLYTKKLKRRKPNNQKKRFISVMRKNFQGRI